MQPTLRNLQRRTANEAASYARMQERLPSARLDLREFVNSRLQHPVKPYDQEAIQAFADLSESCRQHSGEVASGTWLPLNVLTRDLTTANSGSAVVPGVSNEATNSLLPTSGIANAGAIIISGLRGSTFALPTIDTGIDAGTAWIGEGTDAPQIEPTFNNAVLTPFTISVQFIVSRRLLQNSEVDVDGLLRRELAQRLALAIDRAAIQGTGTGQPRGILNHPSLEVVSAGTNGLAPIWSHVAELEYRVMSRIGGEPVRPIFLTSPYLARKLRTTSRVSGQDRFIFEGADMLGHSVLSSVNSPDNLTKGTSSGICSALLFGAMSDVVVGLWGPAAIDILVDGYTLSKQNAIKIIGRAEVGIGVRRIGAFAAYKDLLGA